MHRSIFLPRFLLLWMVAALAFPAFGHGILLKATPGAKSVVSGPAITVELKFNSRVDGSRSKIDIVRPDKTLIGVTLLPQKSPDVLTAKPVSLPPGAYRLKWQILSADGHITGGDYPFTVK